MQQPLINLNADLKQLEDEGYDLEVKGGHLIVRHIPYVTPTKQIDYGLLICILTYSTPNKLSPPQDHTIYFCGETPCNSVGIRLDAIINNSEKKQLTTDIIVTHYFSSKPVTGNYPNYFEKIRTYAEILSIHAKIIDNTVTTKPKKINEQ